MAATTALCLGLWIGVTIGLPDAQAQDGTTAEVEMLRSRIHAYWEARVAESYEEEYEFLDPLIRGRLPLPRFIQIRRPYHVRAFRVLAVDREGSLARVRVTFTFEVIVPNPVEAGAAPVTVVGPKQEELVEDWVERQGTWYKIFTLPPWLGGGFGPSRGLIFS